MPRAAGPSPVSSTIALAAALAVAVLTATPGAATAGEVTLGAGAGGLFRLGVESLQERKFRGIFRQEYDFSCGSAALASLLTFHYERPRTEHEVFQSMYAAGDRALIERHGFSLLDMKMYLERNGVPADGFKVPIERLQTAGIPAIVLIDTDGYKHFVLLKGISAQHVLIGDPAVGVTRLTRDEFVRVWNGIAFVIRDDLDLGRAGFNSDRTWQALVQAPLGTALSRTALATLTTTTYRAGNTY